MGQFIYMISFYLWLDGTEMLKCNGHKSIQSSELYLDTSVQLLQLRHMHDKYTRFHCLLHVESHVTQLTFGPGQELRKKNLAATQATIP